MELVTLTIHKAKIPLLFILFYKVTAKNYTAKNLSRHPDNGRLYLLEKKASLSGCLLHLLVGRSTDNTGPPAAAAGRPKMFLLFNQ